jgi:aspartate/glutamate racemase
MLMPLSYGGIMPQHIGIVACSAEGAALCYLTICVEGAQLLGAHAHPEVSMHTHALAEYMKCIDRNDWHGVGELMLSSANKLVKIGADFLICPDNTAMVTLSRRCSFAIGHAASRGSVLLFRLVLHE